MRRPKCFVSEKRYLYYLSGSNDFVLEGSVVMPKIAAMKRLTVKYRSWIPRVVWIFSEITMERKRKLQTTLFGYIKLKKSPLLILLNLGNWMALKHTATFLWVTSLPSAGANRTEALKANLRTLTFWIQLTTYPPTKHLLMLRHQDLLTT